MVPSGPLETAPSWSCSPCFWFTCFNLIIHCYVGKYVWLGCHICQLVFSLPSWRILVQMIIPNPLPQTQKRLQQAATWQTPSLYRLGKHRPRGRSWVSEWAGVIPESMEFFSAISRNYWYVQNHGLFSLTLCWVKEVGHRVHPIGFHLYEVVEWLKLIIGDGSQNNNYLWRWVALTGEGFSGW